LEGSVVVAVEVSNWYDLALCFSNGQQLHILDDFSPQL
jgi:hypothetical protein